MERMKMQRMQSLQRAGRGSKAVLQGWIDQGSCGCRVKGGSLCEADVFCEYWGRSRSSTGLMPL